MSYIFLRKTIDIYNFKINNDLLIGINNIRNTFYLNYSYLNIFMLRVMLKLAGQLKYYQFVLLIKQDNINIFDLGHIMRQLMTVN